MRVKEAIKITGSMTRTKKMPGLSYSLPAWECITGKKLRKIKNSVCAGCYALKGNYTRYPAIKAAQYYRLASLMDPDIVPSNLIIRLSGHMVDGKNATWWPWTSSVSTQGKTCPAKDQGNQCGSCRSCWNREVPNVTYPKH